MKISTDTLFSFVSQKYGNLVRLLQGHENYTALFRLTGVFLLVWVLNASGFVDPSDTKTVYPGAERMSLYLDSLKGKRVAVVANQNTLLIYINGTLSYTTPLNRVARRDNTPVWIGNRPGQSQGFNGGIADVRIWNVARTQAEIQANLQGLVYNTPQGI
jgi:hypothetical protein